MFRLRFHYRLGLSGTVGLLTSVLFKARIDVGQLVFFGGRDSDFHTVNDILIRPLSILYGGNGLSFTTSWIIRHKGRPVPLSTNHPKCLAGNLLNESHGYSSGEEGFSFATAPDDYSTVSATFCFPQDSGGNVFYGLVGHCSYL